MDYFSNLFDKKKIPQLVLSILFVIFLVMGYKIPNEIASLVNTTFGNIFVIGIALFIFAYYNPILGILALFVAYHIIKGSSITTGIAALAEYYPTEQKKWSPFTPTHQFPYTLEQEMVKTMTTQKFNTNYVKTDWRPILDDTHDAAPISQ